MISKALICEPDDERHGRYHSSCPSPAVRFHSSGHESGAWAFFRLITCFSATGEIGLRVWACVGPCCALLLGEKPYYIASQVQNAGWGKDWLKLWLLDICFLYQQHLSIPLLILNQSSPVIFLSSSTSKSKFTKEMWRNTFRIMETQYNRKIWFIT